MDLHQQKNTLLMTHSVNEMKDKGKRLLPSRLEDGKISINLVQPQSAATKAVPSGQCMETLPEGAICINFFSSVKSA